MYINKWIVVCAASFTQLSAGLPYCFSVYSEALKQHFNWTQIQLQTVGFACSLGAYLGVISGLFYDWLRKYDKLGPRLTLLIGMTMNIVGFTALWAAGSGYINASLWQVAIFAWIAHNNGTWFDTSSMVTTVRNFPNHRGTVVGAMKSITGISGAIYVQVYLGFFAPDSIGFILFLALMPFAISCVTICFLNHVPFVTTAEVGRSTNKRLLFMYGVIIVLAVYVTLTALWQGLTKVPHHVSVWITYGVGLLLAPLLLLPVRSGGFRAQPLDPNDPLAPRTGDEEGRARSTPVHNGTATQPLLTKPEDLRVEEDIYSPTDSARMLSRNASYNSLRSSNSSTPARDGVFPDSARSGTPLDRSEIEAIPEEEVQLPEYTLGGAVMTVDFWLLAVSSAVGMGCGLVLNNNLAQVVGALGGGKDAQGIHVSLFAVANCFGRLLAGYAPQHALNNLGVPRPWFLALLGVMTSLSALLNAFASLDFLIISAVVTGMTFGCHWTLLATLTSEVFGLKYFATIYKLLSLSPSIGGYLLATVLAGRIYDAHSSIYEGHHSCKGPECFRDTFLICSALSLIEAVAGVILVFRTRHIYKALLETYRE
mmetsp:Transcript_40788/g.96986  ORF Transcript_40788/g.96986 Transcript_40788/m.96986 type:complete len:595 (-) Transcript_40788:567-2351(-)